MTRPLILAFVLSAASFAHAQRAFVEARYLPGNELWHSGVVRIHPITSPVTISSPLTVEVLASNAKGELLKPKGGPVSIDWNYQIPEDQILTQSAIVEIPIGTYEVAKVPGTLDSVIYLYDVSAIARVWISFSIWVGKSAEQKVTVEVPASEVRRAIGRRVGG